MRYLSAFIFLMMMAACEKAINFQPQNADTAVVVEAYIENGQAPIVILSKSMDYFSKINQDILANSFINGATIFISNGTKTHKLREYIVPVLSGYNLFYYSIDSFDLATAFVGEFNKAYSLRIIVDGKE